MARYASRLILLATVSLVPLLPTTSYGWGDDGHEIIGVIAQARLTQGVKRKIDALLAADKDTLTAPDFVSRTTWADKYRDSDRNTTRVRYEATRNWHFVDIELADANIDAACNHYPKLPPGIVASAGPAQDCIINKVNQFIAELRNVSIARVERILALKFLLHLVGDLHQPLHAADNKDRGGNDVKIVFGDFDTPGNLHSYWDGRVVELIGNDPKAIGAALGRQITRAKADEWSKGTPTVWARDSFRQARNVAYNFFGTKQFIDDKGFKTIRLNAAYDNRAVPAAREQLSKAGVRLAAILNENLK